MSKIISVNLNLSKIDKSKIYKGEKGSYLGVQIAINDEPDEYGNNASVWVNQTKEEREAKAKKVYLGNGKIVWSDEAKAEASTTVESNESDDLPY